VKGEPTLRSRTIFKGRILELRVLDVRTASGRVSQREVISHGGAVAVLVIRPDGRLVFVRQFRKALERTTFEVVAGGREPGETPAACARREVREETGFRVRTLRRLGKVYAAPGYCTEALHLFVAHAHPDRTAQEPDEDENLRLVTLTPAQFEARIRAGRVEDSKTLATWLLYLRRPSSAQSSRARR
jgi:ADP-ribose pyrophosphatase